MTDVFKYEHSFKIEMNAFIIFYFSGSLRKNYDMKNPIDNDIVYFFGYNIDIDFQMPSN